ncbi:MAG: carboxypeptidase-like regulatory domain-containing protein [Myxococcota bacterium]|nr:carboxypeptidase-like regulatory domain-containing protein [Myxococcota bacterium]
MRRFAFLAVGLLAFLSGILWLLREEPVPPEPAEQSRQLVESMRDRAARPPPREELSADGALELQGRVLAPDGSPVGGALLSVTARASPPRLSGAPCVCEDSCRPHTLDGSCPQAPGALLERVAAREGEPQVLARTTSAADGSFVLRGLEARDYRVWADSERGVATEEVSGTQRTVEVTLEEGWVLTGKIVGGDRAGLAGAVVTVVDAKLGRYQDVLSAADGTFSLGPLPTHPQLVVASLGALLPNAKEVTPGEALVLELATPLRIEGQVLRDDVPVEGAEVVLSGMHRTDTVRSAASGRFSFDRLRSGTYSVRATEGRDTGEAALNLQPQKPNPPLLLRLEEGGVLMGTVRNQDGAPVPGAQVSVSVEAPGLDPTRETVSDAEGNFRIDPLLPGEATVWAAAEGYLAPSNTRRTLISLGQPAQVEVKLERAAALSGVLVDEDGDPVQGAKVVGAVSLKGGDDATTGADGRFTLEVAAGPVRFTAKHSGFRDHASTPTAPSPELRVVLQRGLQLRGRVLDEAGGPVKGARVMAVAPGKGAEPDQDLERVTESGAGGAFHVGGLEPGAFLVAALVEKEEGGQRAMRMGATRVVLPFDGELTVRLKAGASIRGVVVDQHGRPAEGIRVQALLEGLSGGAAPPVDEMVALLEAGSPFGEGQTSGEGRFEIRNLRPGHFALHARAKGYEPLEIRARAGEKEARLVVRRLPRLSGRVLGSEGQPLTRFTVNGVSVQSTDGRFQEPISGRKHATIRAPDHAEWSREIQLGADDLDLGDVLLVRGQTVAGRVVDGVSGAGIPGALVDLKPTGAREKWSLSVERGAARTDREGRFQLRHVEPGEGSRLYVSHPDYEKTSAPPNAGGTVVPLTQLFVADGG